ncbi:MAG: SDR family oxidoreductase [Thermoplasmataceae archaeon]
MDGIKVLVIGGSGFVGSHLMRYFAASGTSSTEMDGLIKLDIRDSNQIRRVIGETNPELVINSSGLTNVDYCETHPEEALEINGTAVGNIADCAEENGSILCHISTDYVFPGSSGNYKEEDRPDPVNNYGISKKIGEEMLNGRKNIILRISTPYGINYSWRKKTFLEFVVSNLNEGKKIRIVTDQFTTPTYVNEISLSIEKLYNARKYGTYHLGSIECLSRYDFSLLIADVFSLDRNLIEKAKPGELNFVARRPLNVCMNCSKIREIMNISDIESNLKEIRKNFQS